MSNNENLETRLVRMNAYIGALEEALVSILDNLPNQKEVLASMATSQKTFDDLAISEDFTDEELDAFKEARRMLLSLVKIKSA